MENQLSTQFDSSNDLIHYLNSSKLSYDEYLKSLPPGFHFRPTQKELIVDYLIKKINNEKTYPNPIKDVDIYKFNPENLADVYKVEGEREMYFFTPRDKKYKNGQRPKRTTPDGYWKATGADKIILHNGEAVGCDKSLVFYWRKPPCGVKTSWLMHEFRVNNLPPRQRTHEDDMRLDDWVLCKIYNNSEKKSNNNSTKRKRDDDRYDQIQETNNNTNQEVEPTADGSSKNVEQEDLWGFNKLETMLISDTFLGNGVDIMKDYDNLNYQNFYNPDYIYVDESILLNQNAGTYTNLVPTSMVPPNFLMGGYDYNSQNPVAYEPGLTELYDELPEIPTIDELLGSITARHEPVPTGQHEELPEILTMDINELLDSITCGHEPVPTGQVHEENNCGIPEMDNSKLLYSVVRIDNYPKRFRPSQ